MARDYLTLGPTPAAEDCEPANGDHSKVMKECRAYLKQLQRKYPDFSFGIKSFPHDFGSYYEVVVYFNDQDDDQIEAAYLIENNLPEHWDEEARKELEGCNAT